ELAGKDGVTLVVCGDTPLIEASTMEALLKYHHEKRAKATILTTVIEDPTGYGRIIRDDLGIVEKIVEHKDATEKEQRISEINTGTYCFDNKAL
ncbi:bifunctional UDP-N-acetylglucosamine diphosphorylase/glucosamine-1-phosphate N-acetyltransferase GlmU, partial [Escherichia coli]|nr:bifunctional UDP-N-acetylglucosamine diphosphorylase/glucosamine-1-phosphate N-acetyltransferase GlmU [Escherichia coli]